MTQYEFNKQQWYCRMKALYNGVIYQVASVDFEEGIIELIDQNDYRYHARYENVKIVDCEPIKINQ